MKAELIFTNGKIYTENDKEMWAEEIAVSGKHFIKVGISGSCEELIDEDTVIVDLEGKTVLPGILDGHTHPTTVAKTIWHVRMPLYQEKEKLMDNIKYHAEKFPKSEVPYFFGECYLAETFGSEGPKKELLDEIFPDRPARMQDFTDHACWYNSIAIDMLGVADGSGEIQSGLGGGANVKRYADGEPTGWVFEASPDGDIGIYKALNWDPPTGTEEESVGPFLDYLKSKGVMCLWDGYTDCEEALRVFNEMDKNGRLNMFYEGSVLLEKCEDIDMVIDKVHEWDEKYRTDHIRVNCVKYFMDGTNEIGDSASLEPFKNDPSGENYGHINASKEELSDILVKLNRENIDMHIHVVCDRGFRTICDAVEDARNRCGDDWKIYVTLAHCELIHPDDKKRVAELGIFIDWSPHWAGGYFGENAIEFLGRERWESMYDFTEIIESGGMVGFSSDLYTYMEANRGDPFIGIQTGITRVDIEEPLDPDRYKNSIRPSESAKLSLEQLLRGYTYNNAFRMRLIDRMGSIEKGKLANFIVLNKDIFNTDPFDIQNVRPIMIYFEGKRQEIKDIKFID